MARIGDVVRYRQIQFYKAITVLKIVDINVANANKNRIFAFKSPINDQGMKKDRNRLCSIQEYNQFKTRIFDAIAEWENYYDCESAYGLLVDSATLQTCEGECQDNGAEWNAFDTFYEAGAVSADAIKDFIDKFCFVR